MVEYKETVLKRIEPILRDFFEYFNKRKFIPGKTKVNVGWPLFDEKEMLHVISSFLDMQISQGPAVLEFEKKFAEYQGVKYAVAVNSGSSANLLSLSTFMEANEAKPGDEVIVPAATFATVASPIIQLGLVPVFVDVEQNTYNIDPEEIKKAIGPATKIIMPVHSLGNPANMPEIMDIAKKHDLNVLEDFCESHGAILNGKKVGSFSDMSTLSFFVAHNITTGDGGMIFTNNPLYDKLLRSMREFGRFNEPGTERFEYKDKFLGNYDLRYVFQHLGFNVRMTDLCASIGIEQLKKLDKLNDERIKICNYYIKNLKQYERWVQLPESLSNSKHTYYAFPLLIKKDAPFSRIEIIQFLEEHNIETRFFFGGCLPDQPAFRDKQIKVIGNLRVSRCIRDSAFFIGCHPGLEGEGKEYVINMLKKFFAQY